MKRMALNSIIDRTRATDTEFGMAAMENRRYSPGKNPRVPPDDLLVWHNLLVKMVPDFLARVNPFTTEVPDSSRQLATLPSVDNSQSRQSR